MKDKLIIFFAGLLLGAIISTGSIYFYTVANSNCKENDMGMDIPERMNGQGGMFNGDRPENMPNDMPKEMPN